MDEWPFDDPENVATLTVRQVTHGGQPILLVAHDADDGMWQCNRSQVGGDQCTERDKARAIAGAGDSSKMPGSPRP
jgi:hypothetical protein